MSKADREQYEVAAQHMSADSKEPDASDPATPKEVCHPLTGGMEGISGNGKAVGHGCLRCYLGVSLGRVGEGIQGSFRLLLNLEGWSTGEGEWGI